MTYVEFIKNLSNYISDFSDQEKIFCFVSKFKDIAIDKEEMIKYLSSNDEVFIDSTKQSLEMILETCNKKENKEYIGTKILETFVNNIQSILQILDNIKKSTNTIKQDTGETFIKSVDDKVKEMQGKFEAFDERFKTSNKKMEAHFEKVEKELNSSYSSLIVNNISILGIFVAIAFAGFSTTTIFSKIKIDFNHYFLTSLFSVVLVSFLVYNLLLVLFYFVYKINQINCVIKHTKVVDMTFDEDDTTNNRQQTEGLKINNKTNIENPIDKNETTDISKITFGKFLNPFIKIDYLLLGITFLLFVACLLF